MEKPLNMQMIADKLGVSKATVSRALRNNPRHSSKTRERIQEAAKELGYKKHPLVSALMKQLQNRQSDNFAPVIAFLSHQTYDTTTYNNMHAFRVGAKEYALSQGYKLEEFSLENSGLTPKRLESIWNSRGIKGVIIDRLLPKDAALEIDLSGLASVVLGVSDELPSINRVEYDQYTSILLAVENLRSLGYQRIGLTGVLRNEELIQHKREAAFMITQQTVDPTDRIPMLKIHHQEAMNSELPKWIRKYRPEVIISNQYPTPEILRDAGWRVPEQIGFVYLGWHEIHGELAGIDANWIDIGISAVNVVIDHLNRNEIGTPKRPIVTLIEGRWVEGKTLIPQAQQIPYL